MLEAHTKLTNWAGNYTYNAKNIYYPATIEEVQEIVSRSPKIRAVGSRHSFNDIADSTEDMISLSQLAPIFELDRQTVTVNANVTYGQLAEQLHQAGFALHNMASLPHISVTGACATATHGSGDKNANLATAVSAIEFVTANGEIKKLSRQQNPEEFQGAVVNLGGIGVITKITLDVMPAFEMRQNVYEDLPFAELVAHFDEITSSAYSVSCFTFWQNDAIDMVWLKQRVTDGANSELPASLFGATTSRENRHPIRGISAENCTEQMGVVGHWYERLPHFRMGFTPSSGDELQTEYLVPRQNAVAALQAINNLRTQIAPLLHVSEIRTIAADNLWLSPCYQQACVGIHFTWKKNWEAVSQLLPTIEKELQPFDARPHWGKLFTMQPAQFQPLFAKLPDFQKLLQSYDPQGKFRNAFLNKNIFGG